MGKVRTSIKVKRLGSGRSKKGDRRTFGVYVNLPSGVEYRLPNTDFKSRISAIKKARLIRQQRKRKRR